MSAASAQVTSWKSSVVVRVFRMFLNIVKRVLIGFYSQLPTFLWKPLAKMVPQGLPDCLGYDLYARKRLLLRVRIKAGTRLCTTAVPKHSRHQTFLRTLPNLRSHQALLQHLHPLIPSHHLQEGMVRQMAETETTRRLWTPRKGWAWTQ
jgi:hypothetical protein